MPKAVIHGHRYAAAYDALKVEYPRLFDVQAGIDWAVATNPEKLPTVLVDSHEYRLLKTDTIGDTPAFRVLLKILGPTEVELIAIDLIPESDDC